MPAKPTVDELNRALRAAARLSRYTGQPCTEPSCIHCSQMASVLLPPVRDVATSTTLTLPAKAKVPEPA